MNSPFLFVEEVATSGKICLVRLDLNVPLIDGKVGDDTRIRRILPGLAALRAAGARIVILTHLGRPKGRVVPDSFTHGTSEQRMRWLRRGMETGDPAQCDTFSGTI